MSTTTSPATPTADAATATAAQTATAAEASTPAPTTTPAIATARPAVPRRTVAAWLVRVTRPVLAPLLISTACRVTDLLAGVALFALAAASVVEAGIALADGQAPAALWPLLASMAAISLLKAGLRYGEQLAGHFVAFKALELLRGEIFRALLPRSPHASMTLRSGEVLATATKDVDRIEVFFAHTFAPVVSAVLVPLVTCLVIGAWTTWPVALAVLALMWAGAAAAVWLGAGSSLRASRAASAERARLTQHVTDTVQGMNEVLGYGRSGERMAQMAQIDDAVALRLRPSHTWAGARRALIALLTFGAPIAVVTLGAGATVDGAVPVAALAASAAAGLRLTETVRGVEELAGALSASLASAERVWRLTHAPVEVPDGEARLAEQAAHEITWEHVSYSYPGTDALALDDVSLTARAGQWTCLVGASGSGKTTAAQLALRFDSPTQGRILIDGQELATLSADSLYRELGLVSQRSHLFRASVMDNLRLADPQASQEEVYEACRAAGIDAEIRALPEGYDTLVGERGQSLSGGQRQRLSLARTLLARPGLVILDEFTSHLDPALDAQVRAAVHERLAGATVLEITHRLQWSEQADHVVVLDQGRVVQEGDPAVLLEQEGPLRTLAARGR